MSCLVCIYPVVTCVLVVLLLSHVSCVSLVPSLSLPLPLDGCASGTISDSVFGVMYAMTSGIMAWISLGGLIPKALEYDVERNVAVPAIFAGVVLMQTSVALFAF